MGGHSYSILQPTSLTGRNMEFLGKQWHVRRKIFSSRWVVLKLIKIIPLLLGIMFSFGLWQPEAEWDWMTFSEELFCHSITATLFSQKFDGREETTDSNAVDCTAALFVLAKTICLSAHSSAPMLIRSWNESNGDVWYYVWSFLITEPSDWRQWWVQCLWIV